MEIQAIRRGIKGTIHVGRKYIKFIDTSGTITAIGEINRTNGEYRVTGTLLIVTHGDRKEAVMIALRKAGFKML